MITKKDILDFREYYRILLRQRDFVYILPHAALGQQISNYTITFPNKKIISDNYTIIPHASATLVFSSDKGVLHSNLFGPMTKPCLVGNSANQHEMLLIIEFQPGGLFPLTGINQKELTNKIIPFSVINSRLNRLILEILESSNSLAELIDGLDRLLLENMNAVYPYELQIATDTMIKAKGNISHQELSSCVYYSPRHLNRIFENYLGMNTKTFSRMVRVNKAIRLMQNSQCSITSAACATEFYDLSHFIHDFKSICGMTPQEYRNNMSDFYSEIAKF